MVVVKIDGGLGNQMFQYALYLMLLNKYPGSQIDLSVYNSEKFHNGYDLQKVFGTNADVASCRLVNKLGYYETTKISKKLKRFYMLFRKKTHIVEGVQGFDSSIKWVDNAYYDGFWQSPQYFRGMYDEIQKAFQFNGDVVGKNAELIDIACKENVAAIHVRRTDFLNKGNSHYVNLGDTQYYQKAISKVLQKAHTARFFVFSDDIQWVKKNLAIPNPEYIDWNTGSESFRDMQLMIYCKSIIIANSTFSWWGAFLNPRRINKFVIAPEKWYRADNIGKRRVMHGDINCGGWDII